MPNRSIWKAIVSRLTLLDLIIVFGKLNKLGSKQRTRGDKKKKKESYSGVFSASENRDCSFEGLPVLFHTLETGYHSGEGKVWKT